MKIVTGPLLISQAIFNHLLIHSNTPKHHKPVDTPVARKDDALYRKVQRSFPCASLAVERKCVFTRARDIHHCWSKLRLLLNSWYKIQRKTFETHHCCEILDLTSWVLTFCPIDSCILSKTKMPQEKTSCKSFISARPKKKSKMLRILFHYYKNPRW